MSDKQENEPQTYARRASRLNAEWVLAGSNKLQSAAQCLKANIKELERRHETADAALTTAVKTSAALAAEADAEIAALKKELAASNVRAEEHTAALDKAHERSNLWRRKYEDARTDTETLEHKLREARRGWWVLVGHAAITAILCAVVVHLLRVFV